MSGQVDDAQQRTWDTFLRGLPPVWQPLGNAFGGAFGIAEGETEPDGSWSMTLGCGLCGIGDLVALAPVQLKVSDSGADWWLDQHLESEGGVLIADADRVLLTWTDHFAAGLMVTLNVFADRARYTAAVEQARSTHAEVYCDDDRRFSDSDDDGELFAGEA